MTLKKSPRPVGLLYSAAVAYVKTNLLAFTFLAVTNIEQLIAVEGHPTQLPCDMTPPKPGEQVYLVLWYRQDEGGEPIYRYKTH
jgi:hypothetical protein